MKLSGLEKEQRKIAQPVVEVPHPEPRHQVLELLAGVRRLRFLSRELQAQEFLQLLTLALRQRRKVKAVRKGPRLPLEQLLQLPKASFNVGVVVSDAS